MEFDKARPFLESNHRGVVTTLQSGGETQLSIVVCGAYYDDIAFVSIRGGFAKIRNLR